MSKKQWYLKRSIFSISVVFIWQSFVYCFVYLVYACIELACFPFFLLFFSPLCEFCPLSLHSFVPPLFPIPFPDFTDFGGDLSGSIATDVFSYLCSSLFIFIHLFSISALSCFCCCWCLFCSLCFFFCSFLVHTLSIYPRLSTPVSSSC